MLSILISYSFVDIFLIKFLFFLKLLIFSMYLLNNHILCLFNLRLIHQTLNIMNMVINDAYLTYIFVGAIFICFEFLGPLKYFKGSVILLLAIQIFLVFSYYILYQAIANYQLFSYLIIVIYKLCLIRVGFLCISFNISISVYG